MKRIGLGALLAFVTWTAVACGGTGGAVLALGQYHPCLTSQECPIGESCFTNFNDGMCTHACVSSSDCASTDVCAPAGVIQACTKKCTSDADCRSDLKCGPTGACGGVINQTPACKSFVSCYTKTGGTTSLESTYGPTGTCWISTQAAADACSNACQSGLDSLKQAFPTAGC